MLSEGTPIEDKERSIEGESFIVSGSPIFFEDDTFGGGVYVLHSIIDAKESINNVRKLLFLAGIGAFLVALGFTLFISRRLSSPLLEMEQAARELAKGNLETEVKVTTKDEMGSLATAINDLAKDLKRYRDTRREYFANISHELKTPMTYLGGYAKVLQDKMYSTEEEKMLYLSVIQQEVKRLTRLINDLSDLSKMEEDKISLNLEWIDLVEVIDNVISKTNLRVEEKGLLLTFNYEQDIPLIYGDGFRLEQVFLNLIDNSIRYTDEGLISIELKQISNDEITVEINDSGKGIPENELPFIFERFYRVEKSRSRDHGGSGLGLAIVKKLIELHHAKIQVSSQIAKGTKFKIIFWTNRS